MEIAEEHKGKFVIHSKSEGGFWNAGQGWNCSSIYEAYVFSMDIYKLPESKGNDAEWIRVEY